MEYDKKWVDYDRCQPQYLAELRKFIKSASSRAPTPGFIICPCTRCVNFRNQELDIVEEHLVMYGMDEAYKYRSWTAHGERSQSAHASTSNQNMSNTFRMYKDANAEAYFECDLVGKDHDKDNGEEDFNEALKDAETPLYEGCTSFSKISAVVALYKYKATSGTSDKSFGELLSLLKNMLPSSNMLPGTLYEAKSLLKIFKLEYVKIDACPKDCCLFRRELKEHTHCPRCGESRYTYTKPSKNKEPVQTKIPVKVLRYFPIKQRLARMFTSIKMVKDLQWHSTHRSHDGIMRHPVDSVQWKAIDKMWPSFASDPRNLRLGLASDGFNPFGNQSQSYSCWPVVLVNYNLPPCKAMTKENMMLTLLIPGPEQPGNNIDVYLQPLIEDLNELWQKGMTVYDVVIGATFNLKAMLMWTINDFPAYGNLSGCRTHGYYACPPCGWNIHSRRLSNCKKNVFMGHRRYLPKNHSWRKKGQWFDGSEEKDIHPMILDGKQVLREVEQIQNDFGKSSSGKRKRKDNDHDLFRKKSIFFDLPYWVDLCLRHNLDVMHIEKNICDSLVGTLLDIKGKTKDGLNSRKDLVEMSIREDLHPVEVGDKKYFLPAAPHTLSKVEKHIFCKRLKEIKLPDGYASNIAKCVDISEMKLYGLKSHDCHVLMQNLLPVAIRGLMPQGPRVAIFRLCRFYNELCQRELEILKLEALESEIAETMCMLERYFPPSFFDVMVHLTIHLAREARLCGPVHYRWMYPFERYMKVLKGYVRNRARPEGCIAENYLADEYVEFCSRYIPQTEDIGEKQHRNDDIDGRPLSAATYRTLSETEHEAAHKTVLFNMASVEPYLCEHREELQRKHPDVKNKPEQLQTKQLTEFKDWFRKKMSHSSKTENNYLAMGPSFTVLTYTSYLLKGRRYRTIDTEKSTQDSGVTLEAETIFTEKDGSQTLKKISYYGVLREIILLDYRAFTVLLFRCDWVGGGKNDVKVEDGLTLVNLNNIRGTYTRDPFILAVQATQVFYSRESSKELWSVVLRAPPRGFFDVDSSDVGAYTTPLDASMLDYRLDNDEGYARDDCEAMFE